MSTMMSGKEPTVRLEDLKKRMSKAQPLQIDPSGRLTPLNEEPASKEPGGKEPGTGGAMPLTPTASAAAAPQEGGGLRLKPSRWFAPWYESLVGRLLLEQKAMVQYFPQFSLVSDEGQIGWLGELQTNRNNSYHLVVMYPYDFPSAPPKVYPIDPPIHVYDEITLKTRHQYPDGHLCLYYPQDRTFQPNATAATVVGVAAAWLFAYESWLESAKQHWPGDEVD